MSSKSPFLDENLKKIIEEKKMKCVRENLRIFLELGVRISKKYPVEHFLFHLENTNWSPNLENMGTTY